MKFIVVALHIEASPLIRHLELKRDNNFQRLPLYRNNEYCLVVSGTGEIASAIALAYILGIFKETTQTPPVVFNFGCAGSPSLKKPVGELFLANRITHNRFKREFIPEILIRHSLDECTVTSFDTPQSTPFPKQGQEDILVEMEAYSFFQAAITFLPVHCIHVLKIVSDHLETDFLDKKTLTTKIDKQVHSLIEYIETTTQVSSKQTKAPSLSQASQTCVKNLTSQFHLTSTQLQQLQEAALCFEIQTKTLASKVMHPYLNKKILHKSERNQLLKDILKKFKIRGTCDV